MWPFDRKSTAAEIRAEQAVDSSSDSGGIESGEAGSIAGFLALLRSEDSAATREMAVQVPTISGGIDLISNIVAGTPLKLYRDNDGAAEEIADDVQVKLVNDETGDTLDANQFWKAMIRD